MKNYLKLKKCKLLLYLPTLFRNILLKDIARRFGKFSGRSSEEIISSWGVEKVLNNAKASQDDIIQAITEVLELESEEYGELTVKSLAAASLDAIGQDLENLPSRYFGGIK